MIQAWKRLWRDRRGNALVIAGAALPLVVGSAGLATDTIQWTLWKRQLQRTADSAAIAGVYAKRAGQDVSTQVNNDVTKNNQTGLTLLTGPIIGYPADGPDWTHSVSVEMSIKKKLSFSSMFLSNPPTITVKATAAAVEWGEYCAQAQVDTNETGITAGGNVKVDLKCGMITNSRSMDAAVAFGSSEVTASPVAAVGGLDKTDNWAAGTVLLPFTIPQPDPFSDINPAPIASGCQASNNDFTVQPSEVITGPGGTGPFCYNDMDFKGDVTLTPGTYVVTGNFNANSGAKVTCNGCTFIMTNSNPADTGTVDINGGATMNLTAPDSGTYKGILFYSNRGSDPTDVNRINGNASSMLKGAFYFPHQEVVFTGTAGVEFQCIKLVSWKLTFMGNAAIKNNCPNWYDDRFVGRHVRLVA